jgi:NAD(P)H-hydrate epimerase
MMSSQANVPYLTTEQMIEVDRAMIEDYHIELIQMMESAGRNLAHLARMRFLGGNPIGKTIVILAGTGGNGGGALVAARWLHNWGTHIRVFLTKLPEAFTGIPAHQLDILQRMQVPISQAESVTPIGKIDLIIDGIIGYSLSGAPRGAAADLIRWANAQEDAPILALDTPSGLDTTTGAVFTPAIKATATMTLALPKEGFRAADAERYIGELYLADVSVPPSLFTIPALRLNVDTIFAQEEIVRLR